MKNKKLISECFIEKEFGIDHSKVSELALRQYYFVGKLFPHQKICAHCLIKLQEGSKKLLGWGDDYELMLLWNERNPEFAKLIEDLGADLIRTELGRNLCELPYEQDTYEMKMPIEWGESGERVGNPPEQPKKPRVVVE